MNLGVFSTGFWPRACEALSHRMVTLPAAKHSSGNAYAADLAGRRANGETLSGVMNGAAVDLLLDNGGAGLAFVTGPGGPDDLRLWHEAVGRPLVSHFIDPLVTAFQGLPWPSVWQCLRSGTWIKAVWDRAQVVELQRFGVPNVIHLPMAAPNRRYHTEPLDPKQCQPLVSFVGGRNTSFFDPGRATPADQLLAGTLAQAVRSDLRSTSFYDIYHDMYGLGVPVAAADDLQTQINKTLNYFNAKLFYNASLCIHNRDRFVMFLKRKLADKFRLIGQGWGQAYGLESESPLPEGDPYFDHFRETAININLVNGNAETGLNMRHFEITAAGGFMLCYDQPELSECFEVGKEYDVFKSEAELLDKIEYYLAHPDERCAIALAGQRRTLSQHLYSHRLQALITAVGQPAAAACPVTYSNSNWQKELRLLVPDPAMILDCGANVGQMATGFRQAYPNAEIYCFEPVGSLQAQLREKCRELNAHAVNKAVSDENGKATINLTVSPEANSLLDFQEGNPCARWTQVVGHEDVETCTLDHWCEQTGTDMNRVDIIKLDVQGAELKALRGARKLLETVKAILLEVSFVPIYKDCPLFEKIDEFLTSCGYRRHAVFPSDQPQNWGDAIYAKV